MQIRDDLGQAWTRGQGQLLERMIANLLDNAIRYNERGGRVDVRAHTVGGRVRLTVANGGPRIEPHDVEHLFEPFKRLDRGTGGLGLGLSIVHSVVLAHRGTIELTTPHDGGLVVDIELPAAAPPDAARSLEPHKREVRALTKS